MGFTAGDVIMLLVVLAVVLIFRQLDRGNRSLDKVKRYGDRVMQTLSTFVDDKSSEIRDLTIEVQVGVKQGKELLRTVRGVQEELTVRTRDLEERSTEIDAIRSRIDGYDSALVELVNMSERVDENLRRLRGEDERLRRVDEQRAVLQERVSGFDAAVASLEERLHRIESMAQEALSEKYAGVEEELLTDLRHHADDLQARQKRWQSEMKQGIDGMHTEGAARIVEAQESVSRELQERIDDLQRRSSAEIENVTATVDRLGAQITERFAVMDVELTEVAARIAVFTDQTPLMERADRMHEQLEHLGERMEAVERKKQEVAKIELEFDRTRKLGQEVSNKMTQLAADQRRIDSMEQDFQRLLSVSEEVDLKIGDMEVGRDALEEVQTKLKEFGELSEEADTRYQKLIDKHEIAEATSRGVDRNSELLNQLDERIVALRPETLELAAGLAELQGRVDALAINKESADAVIRSFDGVEGLLSDLEGRSQRLMTARDWLARAETRLEQIRQEARASVQELESLIKTQSKSNGDVSESRPQINNREAVSKLADQGWSISEIARATKLSRGEVELILEVEPTPDALSRH